MTGNAPENSEPPLKIVMTADAVGGVWQYCVDLVRGLTERGAEVLVATMGPRPSDQQKQQLLAIPRVTLAESDYALEWMPNPWRDVDAAGKWLLDVAGDFGAAVIHLNGYAHANLAWRKPVVVTAHSCVYSWWKAVHGCAPGADWEAYKRRVIEGLAASNAVTAPSRYIAAALHEEYGVPEEKVRIIHNFSRAPRPRSREPKQPFLLAVGRIWDPAKNFALIHQIAPKLDWQVRVAGNHRGPESSTPPTRSARCLGPLSHADVLNEMERASIFLHPALYEPFGLAVLEAASRHCCLVLSDIPALRELWSGAALFLDPRHPEQWVIEVNELIRNREKRRALAQRACARAERYRPDSALSEYWDLYKSIARSHPAAKKDVAA